MPPPQAWKSGTTERVRVPNSSPMALQLREQVPQSSGKTGGDVGSQLWRMTSLVVVVTVSVKEVLSVLAVSTTGFAQDVVIVTFHSGPFWVTVTVALGAICSMKTAMATALTATGMAAVVSPKTVSVKVPVAGV